MRRVTAATALPRLDAMAVLVENPIIDTVLDRYAQQLGDSRTDYRNHLIPRDELSTAAVAACTRHHPLRPMPMLRW